MMPHRRKVSNPLGLCVLALLKERPMHPYEVASTLRERAKDQSIKLNYGSLYTVVAALERNRFIRASETVRDGARPERTIYALTVEGDHELHDWMSELLSTPVKEYPQFEAALSLMPILPPEEVEKLLEERIALLQERLSGDRSELESAAKRGFPRLLLIEEEYHLAMLEAELRWVAELLDTIRTAPDFTRMWMEFHSGVPLSELEKGFAPKR